jgi:hypothetical protein
MQRNAVGGWVMRGLVVFAAAGLGFAAHALWQCRRGDAIAENCAEDYCATIRERGSASFCSPGDHELWITRRGNPDYGHVVRHSFADVASVRFSWGAEGLRCVETSGRELFVPRMLYQGGR